MATSRVFRQTVARRRLHKTQERISNCFRGLYGCGGVFEKKMNLLLSPFGAEYGGEWVRVEKIPNALPGLMEVDRIADEDISPITCIKFLIRISEQCGGFSSKERTGKASRSEMERWLSKGSVRINGVFPAATDPISFPVWDIVLFPSSRRPITLVQEEAPL